MFTFHPQWKEELLVSGPLPDFTIDLTGRVYAPSKSAWTKRRFPAHLYAEFLADLTAWCAANDTTLVIED